MGELGRDLRGPIEHDRQMTDRFLYTLQAVRASLPDQERGAVLTDIEHALQKKPFRKKRNRAFLLSEWVSECFNIGLFNQEKHNQNQIIDLCHYVWDNMEPEALETDETAAESPEALLARKIQTKLERFQTKKIGNQSIVAHLLELMQTHPLNVLREDQLSQWLLQRSEEGLIPEKQYYAYLDVLTAEA